MARFTAKRYVLESIWEEQTVECEADSIEEAENKFKNGSWEEFEVTSHRMGELCETNLDVEVEDVRQIKESNNV